MMQFDDKTLQALSQIQVILDFIQNPGDFKTTVANAQTAMADYKKTIVDLTDAQDIDTWHTKALAEVSKAKYDLAAAQQSWSDACVVKDKQVADRISTLTDRETAASVKEQNLAIREAVLKPQEADLLDRQALVDSKLQDLVKHAAELDAREASLNSKADKIKQLLG